MKALISLKINNERIFNKEIYDNRVLDTFFQRRPITQGLSPAPITQIDLDILEHISQHILETPGQVTYAVINMPSSVKSTYEKLDRIYLSQVQEINSLVKEIKAIIETEGFNKDLDELVYVRY